MATRRIQPTEKFRSGLAAFVRPEAQQLVAQLALYLAARPHCAPPMDGSEFHVLHTAAHPELPALRLYYRFDDEVLYLLEIEPYDPLTIGI